MRDGFHTNPRSGEGAGLWFLKILSGLMIIVVLLIHLVVNHLIVDGGLLSYSDVVAYYQTWFVPVMEVFFLVFVVGHAMMGLRSVLLDLRPSNKLLRWINWGLTAVGVIAVVYGTWLVIVITQRG